MKDAAAQNALDEFIKGLRADVVVPDVGPKDRALSLPEALGQALIAYRSRRTVTRPAETSA